MHDHNNNDNGMKSMMWMMIICCAVPLILILMLGAGGRALGVPIWIVLGAVAVMVIAHFFMMGRSKKHSEEDHQMVEGNKQDNDKDKNHSGHGCCH